MVNRRIVPNTRCVPTRAHTRSVSYTYVHKIRNNFDTNKTFWRKIDDDGIFPPHVSVYLRESVGTTYSCLWYMLPGTFSYCVRWFIFSKKKKIHAINKQTPAAMPRGQLIISYIVLLRRICARLPTGFRNFHLYSGCILRRWRTGGRADGRANTVWKTIHLYTTIHVYIYTYIIHIAYRVVVGR